ncbi:hypothetical protein BDN72DRAFT_822103 [Pluteus cervinus]|uniref:Uncharacterized protein n=2 Tax=Pluteus cervinus TaxID=181527 RepID=A0ACD3A2Y2_9AGAR|nr:hypothetical protein BDN72DRAFT_806060 [Pluteus cervinus]TFK67698.1 hypothetical protein BDN72DRAFT_822103 [Pluteus cervinus]
MLAAVRPPCITRLQPCLQHQQVRNVSRSPYGRTHVWKRRAPPLPNPVVPKFPQRVIRSDGTSFIHWTTSPKSIIRLTRDTTSNPLWNTGVWTGDRSVEEEGAVTGRLGRFKRKFEELGGTGGGGAAATWLDDIVEVHSMPEKSSEKDKSKSKEKSKK